MTITEEDHVFEGDRVKLAEPVYFSESCHIVPGTASPCLFPLSDFCKQPQRYGTTISLHWEKGELIQANTSGKFSDVTWADGEGHLDPDWFDQEYGIRFNPH